MHSRVYSSSPGLYPLDVSNILPPVMTVKKCLQILSTVPLGASSPMTSWQINGETMETVTDFTFLGSKITADGDCSHEIKRHLLLGTKAMTNLDSILKSREVTFPTKVRLVKAMVFRFLNVEF